MRGGVDWAGLAEKGMNVVNKADEMGFKIPDSLPTDPAAGQPGMMMPGMPNVTDPAAGQPGMPNVMGALTDPAAGQPGVPNVTDPAAGQPGVMAGIQAAMGTAPAASQAGLIDLATNLSPQQVKNVTDLLSADTANRAAGGPGLGIVGGRRTRSKPRRKTSKRKSKKRKTMKKKVKA